MVEKCNESQIPALQNEGERVDFSLDPYVAPERGSLDMGDGDLSWEENNRPQHDDHD